MRRSLPVHLAAALLLAPASAFAQAALTDASPSADSVAKGAPNVVELTFSEAIQPASSTISVKSDSGKRMDHGKTYAVGDARHLAVGITLLLPGHYRVDWRVTATHAPGSSGTYGFTVSR